MGTTGKTRVAVFPGSFDPVTRGHVHIVERGLALFDRIIVGLGVNTRKQCLFSVEDRLAWLRQAFARFAPRVEVRVYRSLTVEFCRSVGARFILRGLRTLTDLDQERTMAHINRKLAPEIETVVLFAMPEYIHVSSTLVREIILQGGDPAPFLPEGVRIRPEVVMEREERTTRIG